MARFTLPKNALLLCRWREVKTLGSRDCPLRPVRFVTPATVAGDGVSMSRNRHGVPGAICTRSAQCGAVSGVDGLPLHPWACAVGGDCRTAFLPSDTYIIPQWKRKVNSFFKNFFDRLRRLTSKYPTNKKRRKISSNVCQNCFQFFF